MTAIPKSPIEIPFPKQRKQRVKAKRRAPYTERLAQLYRGFGMTKAAALIRKGDTVQLDIERSPI